MDDLSLWELRAAIDGWMTAQGVEPKVAPPTDEEHDALMAKYA